jgi:hypothetical protein
VDGADLVGSELYWIEVRLRVEALVAVPDPENCGDSVVMVELQDDRPHDVVEARTEAAAGDDCGSNARRLEEQPLARAGSLQIK